MTTSLILSRLETTIVSIPLFHNSACKRPAPFSKQENLLGLELGRKATQRMLDFAKKKYQTSTQSRKMLQKLGIQNEVKNTLMRTSAVCLMRKSHPGMLALLLSSKGG